MHELLRELWYPESALFCVSDSSNQKANPFQSPRIPEHLSVVRPCASYHTQPREGHSNGCGFNLCYPGQKPQLDLDLGAGTWIQEHLGMGLFHVNSVLPVMTSR